MFHSKSCTYCSRSEFFLMLSAAPNAAPTLREGAGKGPDALLRYKRFHSYKRRIIGGYLDPRPYHD